jgi:hypothetical protein
MKQAAENNPWHVYSDELSKKALAKLEKDE